MSAIAVREPDRSDIRASETARLRMALELQSGGARLEEQIADTDLTLQVLVEMRDEMRQTNRQLGELRGEVGELRGEVRGTNQRLDLVEHTLVDFGTQVVLLGRYMKNSTLRHDDEIADLRTRVEKLEAKD